MRAIRSISCLSACAVVAACSIHPIPDDVSMETTPSIVKNIRCEVREEVKARLQKRIDESKSASVRGVLAEHVLKPAVFNTLKRHDPEIATKILKYQTMTIAYSFDFDIKEGNNNSAGLTLSWPLTNPSGSFGLVATGKANFNRDAKRTFAITDSFEELTLLKCNGATAGAGKNFAYPITGSIGAKHIIDTYLDLSEAGATGDTGPFTDEITFTTEIGGGITPTLTLAPVPNRFRLIDAHGEFGANRKDIHKVTIVITFPNIDDRIPVAASSRQQIEKARRVSARVAAEELCILKQRRELREQQEAQAPGAVLVTATQNPSLIYCQDARLR